MLLTKLQVQKVAELANLTLTSMEEEKFSDQLSKILDYIDELNRVDTLGVEACFNVVDSVNVLREDLAEAGLTQEEALTNAPVKKEGFFVSEGVFK